MGYSVKMFVKEVPIDDAEHEVKFQNIATKYQFCPRVMFVDKVDTIMRIYMEHLDQETLADTYGDDPKDIPEWIWKEIRYMISTLYEEEGIEYRDITPYNFIEKDDRVYMIDFGDAKYKDGEPDWFLSEFLEGENSWNPDYK